MRRRWVRWAVLVVVVLATGAMLAQQPAEQQPPTRYSSYDLGPLGLRALYLTLKELDYKVERLRWPASPLSLRQKGVLISLDPAVPVMPAEWRATKRWVAKGNLVIISPPGCWVKDLVRLHESRPLVARPSQPSFLSRGVDTLRVLPNYPDGMG